MFFVFVFTNPKYAAMFLGLLYLGGCKRALYSELTVGFGLARTCLVAIGEVSSVSQ
jgi:hypothetical protein